MMNLQSELVQLGFMPVRVQRSRETWIQQGQRRVVLLKDRSDVEKLRKLRRRHFYEQD